VEGLLRLSGFDATESRARTARALESVDLLGARGRRVGGYSRGMRQRLKLALALAHDPDVLLLDEPLTGLDPLHRRRVIEIVRRLGQEGKTIVVSSHILPEVEAMTRRIVLIHKGRILAEGDVREIRALLDQHPHTVALRSRAPRALAERIVAWPHVLSLAFGSEGEWLTVQTAQPAEFYGAITAVAAEAGVTEMYSPDEDLESVFKYLVAS
jgi:ABC-2 type transport system ATP-binding protein